MRANKLRHRRWHSKPLSLYFSISLSFFLLSATAVAATSSADANRETAANESLVGSWVINEELSDNTDKQVEVAIKKAGGKVARNWFGRKEEDRYRGGPPEQELYDRISYDDILKIEIEESAFRFEYADGYQRLVFRDGRRRSVGANEFYSRGGEDYSFGNWEGKWLSVEARPRDGGYTLESYSLQADGEQLVVEMEIKPESFQETIILTRVYDKVAD